MFFRCCMCWWPEVVGWRTVMLNLFSCREMVTLRGWGPEWIQKQHCYGWCAACSCISHIHTAELFIYHNVAAVLAWRRCNAWRVSKWVTLNHWLASDFPLVGNADDFWCYWQMVSICTCSRGARCFTFVIPSVCDHTLVCEMYRQMS